MPELIIKQHQGRVQPSNLITPDSDSLPQPQGEEGKSLIGQIKHLLERKDEYRPRGLTLALSTQAQVHELDPHATAEQLGRLAHNIMSLESIYIKAHPWGLECWLVTNHSTKTERFQLYDIEWELMEQMPDINFKFHLIERYDRPFEEIFAIDSFNVAVSLL